MRKAWQNSGLAVLIAVSLVLGWGCSQMSPQRIAFNPVLNSEHLIQGSGSVELLVMDARVDRVIGKRGGAYQSTATITSEKPLELVIEALATQAMEQAGVSITTTFADYQMQIRLDELNYKTEKYRPSVKRTTVSAKISVEVTNGGRIFRNSYQSSQYQDTLGYPNEEKNEELLNSVFNNVLNRLFSDAAMSEFFQS